MAQKAIGPNFATELAAQNLLGLQFSWGADGAIEFGPSVTDVQKTAIEAVYAAHDPTKPDPLAAYNRAVAAGLGITSAGTPQLTGTYGITPQDEINLTGLQVSVAVGVFLGSYRDMAGTSHVMTAAQFTTIATAVLTYVKSLDDALHAALAPNGTWVAPPAQAAIP